MVVTSTYKQLDKNTQIQIDRSRNPEDISSILYRDYFDAPVCYFSQALCKKLAEWIVRSNQLYFMQAQVNGNYAGFLFGHTTNPSRIWKKFAGNNKSYLLSFIWIWLRMHIFKTNAKKKNEDNIRKIQELKLPSLNRPFTWNMDTHQSGCIELLFVSQEYRGFGLAKLLIDEFTTEIFKNGFDTVEAHIDRDNYNSVRSFLKSGFEVFHTTTKDFYTRKKQNAAAS